jgi:hypothetical protein
MIRSLSKQRVDERFPSSERLTMTRIKGWFLFAAWLVFASQQGHAGAAEHGASAMSGFCDSSSDAFYARKQSLPWTPIAPERIVEADYEGRMFEARLTVEGQELFAYKVVMNIGGGPAFVSVALLDRRQERVDVKQLAAQARMLLQDEAAKFVREQRVKEAYPALASNQGDISLWSQGAAWYFTIKTPERFAVFAIVGNKVEYVCTHHP